MKKLLMKKMMIRLKLILLLIFIISCIEAKEFDESYYLEVPTHVTPEEYKRDSLYLVQTGKQFLKYKLKFWGEFINEYRRYIKENDSSLKYAVVIDKIFYDSTYTKLYAYCILAVTLSQNAKWPEDYDHFTARNLMGYRNSLCQPWKVSPYDKIYLSGAPTLDTLIHDLNYFYFVELKDQKRARHATKYNKGGSIKLRYNLDDPEFWTKYPDWQKGATGIDSLYGFQVSSSVGEEYLIREGFRNYSRFYNLDTVVNIDSIKNNHHDDWYLNYFRSKLDSTVTLEDIKERKDSLKSEVIQKYSDELQLDTKEKKSLYKAGITGKYNRNWYLKYYSVLLDSLVTPEDVEERRDSLRLEVIKKYYDNTITMQDIIKKGIDYYTYKPKIDSVSYPDSLLKMYECE